jgi:hypothetical protein
MKQYLINRITALLIILVSITSCDKKEYGDISVTDVKLSYYGNRLMESNEEVDLMFGPTMYLFAVISPENATNQNVMWESSDETVATMTIYGGGDRVGINALAEGKTTITVATEDGKKTASCVVNVFQLKSPSIHMKVSYGSISDYSFTSGSVLRAKQGTNLDFKIQVTQGAPKMQTFRITSWIEAESKETIVMEENLYKGIYEGKNEYEFEYTAIAGNNEEVLFFELVDGEHFFVAQVTIEPY